MNKQYYCEMDKSVFSTEDALLKHLRDNYVKVFENKDYKSSDLLHQLQTRFPEYEVSIKDGNGWYSQYMIKLSKDDSVIEQMFGKKGSNDYNDTNPDTYNQLIASLEEKIATLQTVIKTVDEKFSFAAFEFDKYDYGYSDDEHCYTFRYKVNKDDEWDHERFYHYVNSEDKFINNLRKYFVTVLEGAPDTYYEDGYFMGYCINGVNIEQMMSRNKVRLEVIS